MQSYNFYLRTICLFLGLLCITSILMINSCSNSSEPENNKPSISLITASPDKLAYGETSTITVTASDKDNDNLTFNWVCDDGYFTNTNTTSTVNWRAPNKTGMCGVTVTVGDGEDEVTATASIEIKGLFFDEFETDLSNWSNSFSNSWLSSGEVHVEGSFDGFLGTLSHNLNDNLSPDYTVNMKLARVDNFSSNQYYGLWSEVNDDGDITVSYWIFAIYPSTLDKNWAILCFVYSYSQSSGSWAYLDDNSYGTSTLIKTSSNELNDISWTIEEDKTVIVKVGSQVLYESNEISNLESSFGLIIDMDLVSIGTRTRYNKEVKFDDVVITTPSEDAPIYAVGEKKIIVESNKRTLALKTLLTDAQNMKTLKESINELK